ncbi:Endonuclease, Uma2 family (restriction endonuclease fold) [Amycolatopsis marina]|uniref:Endonuclease, Uma2 family (Restriction endonuclease fold) n=1 Tax=Amycolatopsis marina TaxID=490629 RepID=A0A1I0VG39_9PSEU|nr:Uma2 family endonuclease [Amycolatopsis marina]SFA75325.1 Endonuclease, Uma2 family (restriction endonuclease fold) [Amycolatopsis marina]
MSLDSWTSGERLSLDDWIALPEDNSQHIELVEGVLQVSPKPVFGHQRAAARLWGQLNDQLPPEFEPVMDMDVVIAGGQVATVRVPDVLVIPSSIGDTGPSRLRAEDVLVAVEVISPGSSRTDRVVKFAEYAEAGIPSYWLIDVEPPVSLSTYRLVEGEYELDAEGAEKVVLATPAPLTIDVRALGVSRRASTRD